MGDDEVWTGSKRQKEALRAKFDGRCAYCGNLLDKMHADHLEPVVRVNRDCMGRPLPAAECRMMKPERNVVSNMMPACGPCNLHKGGYTLEQWRVYLQRSAEIVRKQTSTFRAGERFGVITVSDAPIVFYFERRFVLPSGCDYCADDGGGRMLPMYGVAPHECFWRKGPEFTLGQSTLLPFDQWDSAFVPDLEPGETWDNFVYPSACGTFYCPNCDADKYAAAWSELVARIGPPPTQGIEAGTVETERLDPKDESPVGNADAPGEQP